MAFLRAACLASTKMHYRHARHEWPPLGHRFGIGVIDSVKIRQHRAFETSEAFALLDFENANIIGPTHRKARLPQIRFRGILRFLQQLKGLRRWIDPVDIARRSIESTLRPSRQSENSREKSNEALHEQVPKK